MRRLESYSDAPATPLHSIMHIHVLTIVYNNTGNNFIQLFDIYAFLSSLRGKFRWGEITTNEMHRLGSGILKGKERSVIFRGDGEGGRVRVSK